MPQAAAATVTNEELVVNVDTVDQIFNDFDANPFSTVEGMALGKAALEHLLTRLQLEPLHHWVEARLVVRLPANQITPDLTVRLDEAIDRYCLARIEENTLQVRLSRQQHAAGMVFVLVVVLAVIAAAALLFNTIWAGASSTVITLVTAAISVFSWVILWDPLEALLFDWAPPARENRALAQIMKMPLVVQSQT